MIDRRTLIKAGAAMALAPTLSWPANAAKPTAIQSGNIKVTTFTDGHLGLPLSTLAPQAPKAERDAALQAAGHSGTTYASPLNVTLLETPNEKILVDVGSGPHFMGTAGRLTENLEAAGIDPASITKVVYTHAHPDHLWGTINDFDELSFPDAAYFIAENEWNFWMSKSVLSKLPTDRHSFAAGAVRNLNAVKDRLETIKPDAEITTGIRAIATPGHTPGHIALEVGSGEGAVVILGDSLTHPVISFQHHDWRGPMDQDQDTAVATRARLLDKLASDKNRIIGYHLPTPGAGRVERNGERYRFTPLA